MTGHRIHPGGTSDPEYLVTTTHLDGVTCHHTGATLDEVQAFAGSHAGDGDTTEYYRIAPMCLDGIRWVLVA